jgi:hypothetical protein
MLDTLKLTKRLVLSSLVQACEGHQAILDALASYVDRAKTVLRTLPDRIVVD